MNSSTTSRAELRTELGLEKPTDITNIRKALGHEDHQNAQLMPWEAQEVRDYVQLTAKDGQTRESAIAQIVNQRHSGTSTNGNGHNGNESNKPVPAESKPGALTQAVGEAQSELENAAVGIGEQLGHAMTRVAVPAALETFSADLKQVSQQIASRIRGEVIDVTPLPDRAVDYLPEQL